MRQQVLHGGHDFGDPRLVVSAEQGFAVGHQQRLTGIVGELWEVGEGEGGVGFGI